MRLIQEENFFSVDGLATHSFLDQPSEVVLLLFVRSDRRFKQLNKLGVEILIPCEPTLEKLVLEGDSPSFTRKIFIDWYRNEKQLPMLIRASEVVLKGEMRELLPTMLNALASKDLNFRQKIRLLTTVGLLGDRKLLAHIEPLLTDTNIIEFIPWKNARGEQQKAPAVLADVALSVCWMWAGQKHEDLGTISKYIDKDNYQRKDFRLCSCFEDDVTRQAAHAKWKKLRAEMLKADEKKDKK